MKKLLAILLIVVLAISVTACGGGGGGSDCQSHIDSDDNGKCDNCGAKLGGGTEEGFPRYTGFDDTGDKARAALQNCHIFYTYDEDCKGDPSTVLEGEYMTCLYRQYFRTFTMYGYGEHIDGNPEYAEPDNHRAYVFKDNEWTIYDFYRKIIATGGDPSYMEYGWDDGTYMTSFSDNTIRHWECYLKDFEPSYSFDNTVVDKLEPIEGKVIANKHCDGWMEYTTYNVGNQSMNTYETLAWVDPDTDFTLRYEWHVGNYNLDEPGSIFEVTSFELNCVSQSAFDAKIAALVEEMGGEGEFEKMTYNEYWDIFV